MPAVCAQVDPSVSAIVHYVRSLYFKQQRDFAEFYKSSLLYLAFISIDSLSDDQKLVQPCSPALPQPGGPSLALTYWRAAALILHAFPTSAQAVLSTCHFP